MPKEDTLNLIDEEISQKKLYRPLGILSVRVYRRAGRVDVNFTPYWRVLLNKMTKKREVFKRAKLLDHEGEA